MGKTSNCCDKTIKRGQGRLVRMVLRSTLHETQTDECQWVISISSTCESVLCVKCTATGACKVEFVDCGG